MPEGRPKDLNVVMTAGMCYERNGHLAQADDLFRQAAEIE